MKPYACICIGLLAAGVAQAGTATGGPPADVTALEQRIDQWLDGYNHADVARMMDVFSDDFTQVVQDAPGEMDKTAVAHAFGALFARYRTRIVGITDEIRASGDMAFDRGRYTITLIPKAGGDTLTRQGRFLEVWKREGGTWKVQRIMDMHDVPPPQAESLATPLPGFILPGARW